MTKNDIIKAAFKVWGQELYRTTSLSQIARELGVSKPALYRHFKDKDDLLLAMNTVFFDDFAAFIRESYEKAIKEENWLESCLLMMRTFAEYYIRNHEAFIFSLVHIYSREDRESRKKEFSSRGVDFEVFSRANDRGSPRPVKFHLIMATLVFWIAQFHYHRPKEIENQKAQGQKFAELTDESVKKILCEIENRVTKGLGLDAKKVAALDFEKLEGQVTGRVHEDMEENTLLKAVAWAVAEAGPWDVSMEMVARRANLSKSGLYAHFKNKQDMLGKFLITEFSGFLNSAKMQIETTLVPEEQLYLGIISIVDYFRCRPELLLSMEWLKTRKLDLEKTAYKKLKAIIGEIKIELIRQQDQQMLIMIAQWILFMIVNILVWEPGISLSKLRKSNKKDWTKSAAEIPSESFRMLFRFIALGLEGLSL